MWRKVVVVAVKKRENHRADNDMEARRYRRGEKKKKSPRG